MNRKIKKGIIITVLCCLVATGLSWLYYETHADTTDVFKSTESVKTEESMEKVEEVTEKIEPSKPTKTPKPSKTPRPPKPIIEYAKDYDGVIGRISIPSIGINYDIYNICNKVNLRKGICKFYGDSIGGEGLTALAGHNMRSGDTLFTRLDTLKIGDKVYVSDKGGKYTFEIFSRRIVNPEDTSDLNDKQDFKELVLITCQQKGTRRLVLKCKEV